LTRRARRLVVVLALAGGVGVAAVTSSLLGPDSDGLHLVGESSVVVESGDTLWSIADALGGDADVRATIDEIQRLNGLESADLVPGQVLLLP
jgi:nucleoid-associated protein YgaU